MDAYSLVMIGAVLGSQFWVVYKLGHLEQKIKKIEKNICKK